MAEQLEKAFLSPAVQQEFFKSEEVVDRIGEVSYGNPADETLKNVRRQLQDLMQRTEAVCLADVLPLLAENQDTIPENLRLTVIHGLSRDAYATLRQRNKALPPLEITEWNAEAQQILETDDEEVGQRIGSAMEILMQKYGM